MNRQEAVMLARYVKAMCPQQRFDEYTPDAWGEVLEDYALNDAREAVKALVSAGQAFVAVGEILTEIRRQRDRRAKDLIPGGGHGLSLEVPDADPDDVYGYLAALRNQQMRAVNGSRLTPRKLPALSTSRPDPQVQQIRQPGPYSVECPTCKALVGRSCRLPSGKRRPQAHEVRVRFLHGQVQDTAKRDAEIERRRQASRYYTDQHHQLARHLAEPQAAS